MHIQIRSTVQQGEGYDDGSWRPLSIGTGQDYRAQAGTFGDYHL